MEAQNQKQVESKEIRNDREKISDIGQQSNENKNQNQAISMSQQEIQHEPTQVIDQNDKIDQNKKENDQICHKLQEAAIDSPTLSQKEKPSSKQIFQFSQNQRERQYMESIQEINIILDDKQLSKVKFIQKILREFSPYVFKNNVNKKQQRKSDPFDSEVSFDSQGNQVEKKIQSKPKKQEDSSTVFIDSDFFNTKWLDNLWENELLKNMFKYNAIFHCRMVFVLYALTSTKYSFQKAYNISLSKDLQQLKQKLNQNKIRYSFDKNIWTQQHQTNLKKQTKNIQSGDKNSFVLSLLKKDKLFKKIDDFMSKIGFKSPNHPFNKKMTILNQQMYRLRYMKEFSYYSFSNVDEVFKYLKTQDSERFKNIEFYSDRVYATSRRLNLSQIHNNKGNDYEWLQRSHDYIQWLFPNHFRSQFNGSSYPLGYIQAQIFKNDTKLRKLLFRSFEIFIDFMGCSIKELLVPKIPQNGKKEDIQKQKRIIISHNIDKRSIQRLKSCLIYNTHNHLRIMRILACLSVTGLRKYADALLRFLNGLIRNTNINFSSIKSALQKNWNAYLSSPHNKQKALEMCFIPYIDFPEQKIEKNQENKTKEEKQQMMEDEDDHGKKRLKLNSCDK